MPSHAKELDSRLQAIEVDVWQRIVVSYVVPRKSKYSHQIHMKEAIDSIALSNYKC